MKHLLQRAVVMSLLPLVLALAALGVREATYEPRSSLVSSGHATEFAPPPLFLLAAAAPGVDRSMRADPGRSSGRVTTVARQAVADEQRLRASGTLRILADETLADLDLELAPQADTRPNPWPRDVTLHLRGVSARSRATAVPGVRACSWRCSAIIGGVSRDAILTMTWIRLPGKVVELQASTQLDWAPFELPEPWWGWMLRRHAHYVVGVDLVLRTER